MKPTNNPYPKKPGFGLRLFHAETALRKLAKDPFADIYTRGFDNCFECGDGDAIVFALMHKSFAEPDASGRSEVRDGIRTMFKTCRTRDGYPEEWKAIAWPKHVDRHFL